MSKPLVPILLAIVSLALVTGLAADPSSRPTTTPSPVSRPPHDRGRSIASKPFFFITDKDIYNGRFEMTMRCPAHAYRSPQWALEHLKRIRTDEPDREIRVWICRVNQMETLRMFDPVSDVIGVNPFVVLDKKPPDRKAVIWSGLDHPILNSIREIRKAAPHARLFACISVDGQVPLFPKRGPSVRELRWMAFAAIGGNFQGISWRPDRTKTGVGEEITAIERAIKPFAEELAMAHPAGLTSGPKGLPVTDLVCGKRLFVALLSPDYMKFCHDRSVECPLEPAERTGEIAIRTDGRFRVTSATTISGLPLAVSEKAGDFHVPYRLADSAEMLVLNLDRPPDEPASRPAPPKSQGAEQ